MYFLLLSIPLACSGLCGVEKEPDRVGDVKIIGNTITRQHVILDGFGIFPGQVLNRSELREAEQRMNRLGLFRAVVEIESRACKKDDSLFKNILITVREIPTQSFKIEFGTNSNKELLAKLVWEERNFDPEAWPRSDDDIVQGRMFRGGGQRIRFTLFEVNLQRAIDALYIKKDK